MWNNGYKIIDPKSSDAINRLNGYSRILWGYTYDHAMVEKLGIAKYFGKVFESSSIIQTEYSEKHHRRELVGGFEKLKVFFKLGTHNYVNPNRGDGLEHLIQHHKEDFKSWGYNTYSEILDLIIRLTTTKVGIRAGHNKILYKFVDRFGKDQYMFVCYDENGDGHIMNAYGLNEDGERAYPYLIDSYNNFLALIEK